MEADVPPTYYSLHADELRLLQFLLYHLRTKHEKRREKKKGIEISHEKKKVSFD
jgi:hypothetical protein